MSKRVTCTGESHFSSWFDENDECYSHKMLMLDKLIRVLLYKHCKWLDSPDKCKSSDKLNILRHK